MWHKVLDHFKLLWSHSASVDTAFFHLLLGNIFTRFNICGQFIYNSALRIILKRNKRSSQKLKCEGDEGSCFLLVTRLHTRTKNFVISFFFCPSQLERLFMISLVPFFHTSWDFFVSSLLYFCPNNIIAVSHNRRGESSDKVGTKAVTNTWWVDHFKYQLRIDLIRENKDKGEKHIFHPEDSTARAYLKCSLNVGKHVRMC